MGTALPVLGQTISGTVIDVEGTPLDGIPVSFNLHGDIAVDTTEVDGNYMLTFGTSSVPEDDPPAIHIGTWGQLKAEFHRSRNRIQARTTDPDTLYIDGGTEYWGVAHWIESVDGDVTFNACLTPRIWSVGGLFADISMEPEVIKGIYGVGFGQYNLRDNLTWPTVKIDAGLPVLLDQSVSLDDSLYVQSVFDEFSSRTGIYFFRWAEEGEVERTVRGIYWLVNDNENSTSHHYDFEAFEMYAATVATEPGILGFLDPETAAHELDRTLGAYGSFFDPRYGITNSAPASEWTDYDAAHILWNYLKKGLSEQDQNHALLSEMR